MFKLLFVLFNALICIKCNDNSFRKPIMNPIEQTDVPPPPVDEVVIHLKPGSTQKDIDDILKRHPKFVLSKKFTIGKETYFRLKLDPAASSNNIFHNTQTGLKKDDAEVNNLKQESKVDFTEIQDKTFVFPYGTINPDPELADLFHLNNVVTYSMHVDQAWALGYTGRGVTVGVVDSLTQTNHTDLVPNMDADNSYDYYNDRKEHILPSGMYHGTAVSGLIGSIKGNNYCGVGVSYNVKLVAIGLLGVNGGVYLTDSQIAQALSHSNVDIYCNSWGSSHTGTHVAMGTLTKQAIESTIANGRGGKGSIYVWAAGNASPDGNGNASERHTSRYMISITSVKETSSVYYGEIGSTIMAAAYGGSYLDRLMTSLDINDGCRQDGLQGTSFAAPIAVGIIALALEANPSLTWRDVQHLIARTSRAYTLKDDFYNREYKWRRNGRHFWVHPKFGFGLMNALGMVRMAKIWRTVGPALNYNSPTSRPAITAANGEFAYTAIRVPRGHGIRFLEHVKVHVNLAYTFIRGSIEIDLQSPSGMRMPLWSIRKVDYVRASPFEWTFKSVHFWGENPNGYWYILFRSTYRTATVRLDSWSLELYGTTYNPRWWRG